MDPTQPNNGQGVQQQNVPSVSQSDLSYQYQRMPQMQNILGPPMNTFVSGYNVMPQGQGAIMAQGQGTVMTNIQTGMPVGGFLSIGNTNGSGPLPSMGSFIANLNQPSQVGMVQKGGIENWTGQSQNNNTLPSFGHFLLHQQYQQPTNQQTIIGNQTSPQQQQQILQNNQPSQPVFSPSQHSPQFFQQSPQAQMFTTNQHSPQQVFINNQPQPQFFQTAQHSPQFFNSSMQQPQIFTGQPGPHQMFTNTPQPHQQMFNTFQFPNRFPTNQIVGQDIPQMMATQRMNFNTNYIAGMNNLVGVSTGQMLPPINQVLTSSSGQVLPSVGNLLQGHLNPMISPFNGQISNVNSTNSQILLPPMSTGSNILPTSSTTSNPHLINIYGDRNVSHDPSFVVPCCNQITITTPTITSTISHTTTDVSLVVSSMKSSYSPSISSTISTGAKPEKPRTTKPCINTDSRTVTVPFGWSRVVVDNAIVYYSPTNVPLKSPMDIAKYLTTEGSCKCGLECPILINKVFNFDVGILSKMWTLDVDCSEDMTKLCNHKRKMIAMATFHTNFSMTSSSRTDTVSVNSLKGAIPSTSVVTKSRTDLKKRSKSKPTRPGPYDGVLVSQLIAQRDKNKQFDSEVDNIAHESSSRNTLPSLTNFGLLEDSGEIDSNCYAEENIGNVDVKHSEANIINANEEQVVTFRSDKNQEPIKILPQEKCLDIEGIVSVSEHSQNVSVESTVSSTPNIGENDNNSLPNGTNNPREITETSQLSQPNNETDMSKTITENKEDGTCLKGNGEKIKVQEHLDTTTTQKQDEGKMMTQSNTSGSMNVDHNQSTEANTQNISENQIDSSATSLPKIDQTFSNINQVKEEFNKKLFPMTTSNEALTTIDSCKVNQTSPVSEHETKVTTGSGHVTPTNTVTCQGPKTSTTTIQQVIASTCNDLQAHLSTVSDKQAPTYTTHGNPMSKSSITDHQSAVTNIDAVTSIVSVHQTETKTVSSHQLQSLQTFASQPEMNTDVSHQPNTDVSHQAQTCADVIRQAQSDTAVSHLAQTSTLTSQQRDTTIPHSQQSQQTNKTIENQAQKEELFELQSKPSSVKVHTTETNIVTNTATSHKIPISTVTRHQTSTDSKVRQQESSVNVNLTYSVACTSHQELSGLVSKDQPLAYVHVHSIQQAHSAKAPNKETFASTAIEKKAQTSQNGGSQAISNTPANQHNQKGLDSDNQSHTKTLIRDNGSTSLSANVNPHITSSSLTVNKSTAVGNVGQRGITPAMTHSGSSQLVSSSSVKQTVISSATDSSSCKSLTGTLSNVSNPQHSKTEMKTENRDLRISIPNTMVTSILSSINAAKSNETSDRKQTSPKGSQKPSAKSPKLSKFSSQMNAKSPKPPGSYDSFPLYQMPQMRYPINSGILPPVSESQMNPFSINPFTAGHQYISPGIFNFPPNPYPVLNDVWLDPKKALKRKSPKTSKKEKVKKKVNCLFDSDTPPPNVDVSQLKDHGKGPIPKVSSSVSFLDNPSAFLAEQTELISSSLTSNVCSPPKKLDKKSSIKEDKNDTVDGDVKAASIIASAIKSSAKSTMPISAPFLFSSASHGMVVTSSTNLPKVSSAFNKHWGLQIPTSESRAMLESEMFTEDRCESLSPDSGSECPPVEEMITPSSVVHYTAKDSKKAAESQLDKSIIEKNKILDILSNAKKKFPVVSSAKKQVSVSKHGALLKQSVSQTFSNRSAIQQILGNTNSHQFPASTLLSAAARAQMAQQNHAFSNTIEPSSSQTHLQFDSPIKTNSNTENVTLVSADGTSFLVTQPNLLASNSVKPKVAVTQSDIVSGHESVAKLLRQPVNLNVMNCFKLADNSKPVEKVPSSVSMSSVVLTTESKSIESLPAVSTNSINFDNNIVSNLTSNFQHILPNLPGLSQTAGQPMLNVLGNNLGVNLLPGAQNLLPGGQVLLPDPSGNLQCISIQNDPINTIVNVESANQNVQGVTSGLSLGENKGTSVSRMLQVKPCDGNSTLQNISKFPLNYEQLLQQQNLPSSNGQMVLMPNFNMPLMQFLSSNSLPVNLNLGVEKPAIPQLCNNTDMSVLNTQLQMGLSQASGAPLNMMNVQQQAWNNLNTGNLTAMQLQTLQLQQQLLQQIQQLQDMQSIISQFSLQNNSTSLTTVGNQDVILSTKQNSLPGKCTPETMVSIVSTTCQESPGNGEDEPSQSEEKGTSTDFDDVDEDHNFLNVGEEDEEVTSCNIADTTCSISVSVNDDDNIQDNESSQIGHSEFDEFDNDNSSQCMDCGASEYTHDVHDIGAIDKTNSVDIIDEDSLCHNEPVNLVTKNKHLSDSVNCSVASSSSVMSSSNKSKTNISTQNLISRQKSLKRSPEHCMSLAEKPSEASLPSDIVSSVSHMEESSLPMNLSYKATSTERSKDGDDEAINLSQKRCYEEVTDSTEEVSESVRDLNEFTIGDLVWGQIRGFPSWPGKVVHETEVYDAEELEPGKCWVKWFGDHTFTQVEMLKLKTLTEGLEGHQKSKKKKIKGRKMNSNLEAAIHEALIELDKQTSQQTEMKLKPKVKVMKKKKLK